MSRPPSGESISGQGEGSVSANGAENPSEEREEEIVPGEEVISGNMLRSGIEEMHGFLFPAASEMGPAADAAAAAAVAAAAAATAVDFPKVRTLKLSNRCLRSVSNLETFTRLEVLCLDNNRLKTPSGLNVLRHVKWLDLSFNCLTTLEGLECMHCLQDLSVSSNLITSLKPVAALPQLSVLNAGGNKIEEWTEVEQLRQLPRLQALLLEGNPLAAVEVYFQRTLALLPQLQYLDTQIVSPQEVAAAAEAHASLDSQRQARQTASPQSADSSSSQTQTFVAFAVSLNQQFVGAVMQQPHLANLTCVGPLKEQFFQTLNGLLVPLKQQFSAREVERRRMGEKYKDACASVVSQVHSKAAEEVRMLSRTKKALLRRLEMFQREATEALAEMEAALRKEDSATAQDRQPVPDVEDESDNSSASSSSSAADAVYEEFCSKAKALADEFSLAASEAESRMLLEASRLQLLQQQQQQQLETFVSGDFAQLVEHGAQFVRLAEAAAKDFAQTLSLHADEELQQQAAERLEVDAEARQSQLAASREKLARSLAQVVEIQQGAAAAAEESLQQQLQQWKNQEQLQRTAELKEQHRLRILQIHQTTAEAATAFEAAMEEAATGFQSSLS